MKKINILIITALIAVLVTSCKKDGPSIVQNDGLINFTTGDVKIINNGQAVTANTGDTITQGMTVKTGAKSIVDIYFQGSVIRILEKSSVVMTELVRNLSDNKELTELYVENGKVFSKVTRKLTEGEKFRVSTPTAVAGVRGTEFLVSEENGKSNIACIEGKVAVKEFGSEDSAFVDIEAGKEADIEKGKPIAVNELKQQNLENIRRIKDEIKELREDIRRKFEEQREEIRNKVIEQKEQNKARVEDQKATDKANVEAIKDATKIQAEAIKGDITDKKAESQEAVSNFNKPDVSGAKPQIKKFSTEMKTE
jgi:hypothetical protein